MKQALQYILSLIILSGLVSCSEKEQSPYILIQGKTEYIFNHERNSLVVRVATNCDSWHYELPEDAYWIVPTVKDKNTASFYIAPNSSNKDRSAMLVFYAPELMDRQAEVAIKVTQGHFDMPVVPDPNL